jgi:hypothetical protein
MWEGVEPAAVKADWAKELAGFQQSPDAIRYGLEHLPASKPPTVLEFRDICRKAPLPQWQQLPWPEANPEVVAPIIEKLKQQRRLLGEKS